MNIVLIYDIFYVGVNKLKDLILIDEHSEEPISNEYFIKGKLKHKFGLILFSSCVDLQDYIIEVENTEIFVYLF